MITLLSPAKSLDYETPLPTRKSSEPRLLDDATVLIEVMREKSVHEVRELMDISEDLAVLNVERYQDFTTPFTRTNARPALLAFAGDVYAGIDARATFGERDYTEAQKTIRILSGLYGVLRPLDLMQPYRLEMGTQLATERGQSLYDFWGTTVTEVLNRDLADSPGPDAVVNLASNEYFGAVDTAKLDGTLIEPRFEDQAKDGSYKIISFWAKRARGTMAGWLVRERVRTMKAITAFAEDGYRYVPGESTPRVPIFRRDH